MTEVNITPEKGDDTQEHIDAMVKKAEGKEETPAQAPAAAGNEQAAERPEWLPEKFKTPEDMAKAYAALEGKMGGKNDDPGAGGDEEKPAEQAEAEEAANKAVEAAGLDMDALGSKIAEKGDLDAEDYAKLEKQGISQEMVKSYVAGQQALASQLVSRMHETVGGEENFNELLSWAGENLSADEIEAFNKTIDSGSEASVKLALQGLHSRQQAEAGKSPNLLGGTKNRGGEGGVFKSTAEVTRAMADPRYAKDPAYRAEVMAKLERSSVI